MDCSVNDFDLSWLCLAGRPVDGLNASVLEHRIVLQRSTMSIALTLKVWRSSGARCCFYLFSA